MTRTVHELPRGIADVKHIAHWIHENSPQGAKLWLDAYDKMVDRLASDAELFGEAPERHAEFNVRQAFFRTRRGRTYRKLFIIEADNVYILRVRGPGQAKVTPDELK